MSSTTKDDLYSGLASFGRGWAFFMMIIGTLVALLFIVGGIYMIVTSYRLKEVGGVVTALSCPNNKPACITVSYMYDSKPYVASVDANTTTYTVNEPITIWVYPDRPSTGFTSDTETRKLGIIAIVVGVIIFAISFFKWWITRWKAVAAVEGGVGAVQLAGGIGGLGKFL
jgi:hypothetical protein